MSVKKQVGFSLLLLILLMMSACQKALPATQTPTTTQTLQESTLTPSPSNTVTCTATVTPSSTPTPTATPINISLAGTPLPKELAAMTIETSEKVQKLASWGKGRPNVIQLSKDGQVLAVGTDRGAYFYDSLGFFEMAFIETAQPVIAVAFSSNNNFIALGQSNGRIDVYDRYAYTYISRLDLVDFSRPDSYQLDLHFFLQDTLLIAITRTEEKITINHWQTLDWGTVKRFSLANGMGFFINESIALIGVVNGQDLRLQSLLYPEDTKDLPLPSALSASFWDQFTENQGDICPTANGKSLLFNNGSSILHWELLSEDLTYQLDDYPPKLPGPCDKIPKTCLNPQGELAWSCQEKAKPPIETIALTPDNIMVLISRNDMRTEFRRITDRALAWETDSQYTQIQFSPGSEFFFGLRDDGTIEKRNTSEGTLLGLIDAHPSQFYDLAFSPQSSILAASFNNDGIKLLDASSGQVLDTLEGSASSLEFSPDAAYLAAGLLDGTVRIFDLDADQHFDLTGHKDAISDLAFSGDSQNLLTGSTDCTIRLWGLEEEEQIFDLIPNKDTPFPVQRVEFSPVDAGQVLVGNMAGLFTVSEMATSSLLSKFDLRDMVLSKDAQTLAVTGKSTFLFRDPIENAFNSLIKVPSNGNAAALNNDGSLLILATEDKLIFWSAAEATGLHNLPFETTSAPVSLVISPENTLIAVGYQNGLIDLFAIRGN